jgi:hypothetical protein
LARDRRIGCGDPREDGEISDGQGGHLEHSLVARAR